MKKGQIYFVEENGFWMLGKCEKEPKEDPDRCGCTNISSKNEFRHMQTWCFQSKSGRTYRDATWEEIQWFGECERQGKFIRKEEVKLQYEIY